MSANNGPSQHSNSSDVKRHSCHGCGCLFDSKNAVFRHLNENAGQCLSETDRAEYLRFTAEQQQRCREKTIILYGYYIPPPPTVAASPLIRNGNDVAILLIDVLCEIQDVSPDSSTVDSTSTTSGVKVNRSYGHAARGTSIVAQDDFTSAVSEVLALRLPPLAPSSEEREPRIVLSEWIDSVNLVLEKRIQEMYAPVASSDANLSEPNLSFPLPRIQVLGRQAISHKRFNAEMDVSHRRVEYLLPLDFLHCEPPGGVQSQTAADEEGEQGELKATSSNLPSLTRDHFFRRIPCSIDEVSISHNTRVTARTSSTTVDRDNIAARSEARQDQTSGEELQNSPRPDEPVVRYLFSLKKIMQSLTTPIVALDTSDAVAMHEKAMHHKKRFYGKPKGSVDAVEEPNGKGFQDDGKHRGGDDLSSLDTTPGEKGDSSSVMPLTKAEPTGDSKTNRDPHRAKRKKFDGDSLQKSGKIDSDNKPGHGKGSITKKEKKAHVLRRRRYHNFTATVMAHEYLAYRRLDRFFHRATLRYECFPEYSTNSDAIDARMNGSTCDHFADRPYLVLAMTGDLFLTGQACRLIGLFVALARGVVDSDFVDCVFDESYPHLVPTPPAPPFGMIASEAYYNAWEGKMQLILSPRRCNRYQNGWNDKDTLRRVQEWHSSLRQLVVRSWLGLDTSKERLYTNAVSCDILLAEQVWTSEVLEPWAIQAQKQLLDYRDWKGSGALVDSNAPPNSDSALGWEEATVDRPAVSRIPPLSSINATVPEQYQKVLQLLREADSSGQWPTTTPKRQLVMIGTPVAAAQSISGAMADVPLDQLPTGHASSLAIAQLQARSNKQKRTSAYDFDEGQGGASGSFSVGAMPGDKCIQPKANSLFPELTKAAFELERILCPDREPSSTIAINRNAQFRPHTDSGAGAGQSTSLIVGLGTYSGGELVVEGSVEDIRYRPLEFNGWTQRHWTMPFVGERYSLVWFTPKGCENVRGIDLQLP
jgi:hypothetical protein